MIVDAYVTLDGQLTRDSLLRQMDAGGVTRAVVAPSEAAFAVHNKRGNEQMLAAATIADGRFMPVCVATPWRGDDALELIREARHAGARVLALNPAVQGFMLTDVIVDPLLALAAELDLPVYVHTGPHSMGAPTQTVLAAQKHPETRFILAHGGATDHAWDMGVIAGQHMGDNIYLETSLVRPWTVPGLLELAGSDRVLWGSAAPRNDLAFELDQLSELLPVAVHPGFYGTNLLGLIGEVASC